MYECMLYVCMYVVCIFVCLFVNVVVVYIYMYMCCCMYVVNASNCCIIHNSYLFACVFVGIVVVPQTKVCPTVTATKAEAATQIEAAISNQLSDIAGRLTALWSIKALASPRCCQAPPLIPTHPSSPPKSSPLQQVGCTARAPTSSGLSWTISCASSGWWTGTCSWSASWSCSKSKTTTRRSKKTDVRVVCSGFLFVL